MTTPVGPDDCGGLFGNLKCGVDGAVGDAVGGLANSAIDSFVQSMAHATVTLLSTLATVWMRVPSPLIAEGNRPTGVIAQINANLAFYTFGFAVIGILYTAGKMAITRRGDAALPGVRMMVNLIVVCGAGAAVVSAGIAIGDAFAPWIVDLATGGQFSTAAATLITVNQLTSGGSGIGLVVGLAALLGSIAQFLFMIFRGAMLTVLMCVLPSIAGTSATEGGTAALRKAGGWLLAFMLYKPVAAVVYAVGFLLIKGDPAGASGLSAAQNTLMQMLTSLTVILCAALTLPSLVKFLVPMASAGISSMFSGAAVGAAAVATGAAIVTMGGSAAMGGAAAASGGAATGGGSGGAAGVAPGGGPGGASPAPTSGGGGGASPAPTSGGGGAAGPGSPTGGPTGTGSVGEESTTTAPAAPGSDGGGQGAGSGPAQPSPESAAATGEPAGTTQGAVPSRNESTAASGSPSPGPAPSTGGSSTARRVGQVGDAARAAGTAAQAGTDAVEEGGDGPSGASVRR